MGHLWLIGMMGTGKTTVGRELARRRVEPFYDTDASVATTAGKSISEIFAEDGEERFRRLEREVVAEVATLPGGVVATGGGVILDPSNVERMRASGRTILLQTDETVLADRIAEEHGRPLLDGDPAARIREIAADRADRYIDAADVVIDAAGDPEEVINRVEQACGSS